VLNPRAMRSLFALALLVGCAAKDGELSDSAAKSTLEALWDQSDLGIVLGEVSFVRENPNLAQRTDLMSELALYRAAAAAGLITIVNEKDLSANHQGWNAMNPFNSSAPWQSAFVAVAGKGKNQGTVKQVGQVDELNLKVASYKIDAIVSNDSMHLGADRYRVVLGTHTVSVRPEFREAFAQARGQETERRFKVLLKYDPFAKAWLLEAMDLANKTVDFATANVDNRIAQIRLCGPSGC